MLITDISEAKMTPAMAALEKLLEARTGQHIASNRIWRIETVLKPVMRDHGIDTLDLLVKVLANHRRGPLEAQVVHALLNQETSFFRDAAVLDLLADAVMAQAQTAPNRRPKIWSAACAHGQEPLSLAMLFAERARASGLAEPELLATDVSEIAVARARRGWFSQFEIQRGLPVRRMIEWFDAEGDDWVARPELVNRIMFRTHNLAGDPPPVGRFDAILCRNVLLYLSPALRTKVFDMLASVIRPGGLLVLGAGETVIGQTDRFTPSPRYRGLYEPVHDQSVASGRI